MSGISSLIHSRGAASWGNAHLRSAIPGRAQHRSAQRAAVARETWNRSAARRSGHEPEHHLRWFTPAGIAGAPGISEGSRLLAAQLLAVAAPQPGSQFVWPPGQLHGTQDCLHSARRAAPGPPWAPGAIPEGCRG